MKRLITGGVLFLGAVSGCVNVNDVETGGARPSYGRSFGPPCVPGVQGPYGQPVPMAAPYSNAPPAGEFQARMMMANSVPMNMIQNTPPGGPVSGLPGMPPTPVPPGGLMAPPGVPALPGGPTGGPLQPMGGMLPMGGGVTRANVPPGAALPGGVVQAQFANSSPVGPMFPAQRTQVQFAKPGGMKVYWSTQGKDGKPSYSETPLETPGRYNFAQGAIYRLKLTRIPGRPGLELYPTLEVVPTGPKTNEFLAHNSVPVEFSDDDFKQVVDRNYIVKVIYLPDPQFQDAAGAGPDEIVSSRLEPGQDPIQEALRRGSILLVLRIGNIDQGLTTSPPMNVPAPGGPQPIPGPGVGAPPLYQVPFGGPLLPGPGGMIPPGPGVVMPAPNALPPLPAGPGVGPGPLNVPPPLNTPPAPLNAVPGQGSTPLPPPGVPSLPTAPKKIEVPAPKETSQAPSVSPLVVPTVGGNDNAKSSAAPMLPDATLPPVPTMPPIEEPKGSGPSVPALPNLPGTPGAQAPASDLPALPGLPMLPPAPQN